MPLSLLLLSLGCTMGPSAETLIDELRVLATLADPPEAAPGEVVALDTRVVNPAKEDYAVLTWTCTLLGEECAEAQGVTGQPWDGAILSPAPPPDDQVLATYTVPAAFSAFLDETPLPLVQHWALACLPGLCPPIEALRSPEDADAEAVRAWLSDPLDGMAALPMEGVSLALRSLLLSTRSPDDRVQNPTVSCTAEAETVAVGGSLPFTCALEGAFTGFSGAWGYTTAGGWEGEAQVLQEGDTEVEYTYFAPEDPEEAVSLWVIVVDGEGGVGLWAGAVDVVEDSR